MSDPKQLTGKVEISVGKDKIFGGFRNKKNFRSGSFYKLLLNSIKEFLPAVHDCFSMQFLLLFLR